jgi:hypothetical protein
MGAAQRKKVARPRCGIDDRGAADRVASRIGSAQARVAAKLLLTLRARREELKSYLEAARAAYVTAAAGITSSWRDLVRVHGRFATIYASGCVGIRFGVLPFTPAELLAAILVCERDQIVADLESWLIRRFVCQLTNKNYNKFFLALLNRVREASNVSLPAIVRAELRRSDEDTARWPDEAEFHRAWLSKSVYVKSRVDRTVMILSAIESAMRRESGMSEQISLPKDLTVEHLLPQKGSTADYPYSSQLPAEFKDPPAMTRAGLIHALGNLTLLTQGLNSSISNGPFAKKQAEIENKSDLRLNAPFRGQAAKTAWGENDILERSDMLFRMAANIWRMGGD